MTSSPRLHPTSTGLTELPAQNYGQIPTGCMPPTELGPHPTSLHPSDTCSLKWKSSGSVVYICHTSLRGWLPLNLSVVMLRPELAYSEGLRNICMIREGRSTRTSSWNPRIQQRRCSVTAQGRQEESKALSVHWRDQALQPHSPAPCSVQSTLFVLIPLTLIIIF
jgi:hypothetical protein